MSVSVVLYGDTTRELYTAWHQRHGHATELPQDSIQSLFNDISLYPSTSQVDSRHTIRSTRGCRVKSDRKCKMSQT